MTEGIIDITPRLPERELTPEQYNSISDAIITHLEETN